MASLNISLQMLTGEHAPDTGSGWYVSCYNSSNLEGIQSGQIVPAILISSLDAAAIENAFRLGIAPEQIPQLVALGDATIKLAIQKELEFAENEAKKIAGLRKRLQTIGSDES